MQYQQQYPPQPPPPAQPQKKTGHTLHLILTVLTCGAWGVVWLCITIWHKLGADAVVTYTSDGHARSRRPVTKAQKIFLGVLAALVLLGMISSALGAGKQAKDSASSDAEPATAPSAPSKAPAAQSPTPEAPKAPPSKADALAAFVDGVNSHGTAQEKDAVKHVTKIQGVEKFNDILDAPSVYTDLKGGITGGSHGTCKLIVSAFADAFTSDNGLVTVYGADGDLICNGKF